MSLMNYYLLSSLNNVAQQGNLFQNPQQDFCARVLFEYSIGSHLLLNKHPLSPLLYDGFPAIENSGIKRSRNISIASAETICWEKKSVDGCNKKQRICCSKDGCATKAREGGLCAKHGGGKPCIHEGCAKIVSGVSRCSLHGGSRKRKCGIPGCNKFSQSGGVDLCAAHGGGAKCKIVGCEKRRSGKGLCWGHGGGRRCRVKGCQKYPCSGSTCKMHIVAA